MEGEEEIPGGVDPVFGMTSGGQLVIDERTLNSLIREEVAAAIRPLERLGSPVLAMSESLSKLVEATGCCGGRGFPGA